MCERIINEVYTPGIERYFPEALDEMRGIADGAGVELNQIIFLNARYDLARVRGKTMRQCPQQGPQVTNPLANGYQDGHISDTPTLQCQQKRP